MTKGRLPSQPGGFVPCVDSSEARDGRCLLADYSGMDYKRVLLLLLEVRDE